MIRTNYILDRRDACPLSLDICLSPSGGGAGGGVQTGNIVYKTNRVHGLHYTARRSLYAVESDKPYGPKGSPYQRLE